MKTKNKSVKLAWGKLLGFDQVKGLQGQSQNGQAKARLSAKIGTKVGTKGPV